jgi:L-ascorbate metabolism protein UlaG (beta-lactamase superfamily)
MSDNSPQKSHVIWRRITDVLKRRHFALRLAEQLGRGRGEMRWLDKINPPPPAPKIPDLANWENRELSAVWVGHATVLLRISGLTILTDPVLAHRIGLGFWLTTVGPRRQIAAALTVHQLPPLDLILISHAHFDHLDRPTLFQLPKKTPVITSHHTSDLIRDLGFRNITELRWNEQTRVDGITITARQVTHWGARTFIDQHRGYNGYLLESSRRRVLYGGDTAFHDRFTDINGVNLAILGIAAYDPYIHAHATPEQAWQMANHAKAEFLLPIHHSTFRLSHEPMTEPIERMLQAASQTPARIALQQIGQTWIP